MHRPTPPLLLLASIIAITAAACGDDDSDENDSTTSPSLSPSPEASAPAAGRSIGDSDDPNKFRVFAEDLEVAIAEADVQFFLDRALFQDVECGVEFPAPPASCEGQAEGATVPGIVVGVFQSEGFALDEAGYEQFITEYLTAYDESAPPDAYGGPAPRL